MRPVIRRNPDRPGEALAEFRVGISAMPWLSDHCVQGIPILPGSFYIELARFIEQELCGRALSAVRDVRFARPIVLSEQLVTIRAHVQEHADGRVDYAFDEGDSSAAEPAARLQVVPDAPAPSPADSPVVDRFPAQVGPAAETARVYEMLRANGNEYGPGFQRIRSLWTSGTRLLGKISTPKPWMGSGLHPSLLDAMVQMPIASASGSGKTCVLRSIERIDVPDGELPETLWAFADIEGDSAGNSLRGSVQAFDESGKRRLQLSGIELALLDRPDRADAESGTKVVIAANFTAEPVEDALKFWGGHFGAPLRAEFAPYDQVFAQLLDPASALHTNRSGVNVILLRLEAWARRDRAEHPALVPARPEEPCFANLEQHVLPNGLRIAHWKRHETEYLYQEIFEDACYARNGIQLPDDAVVIDVGANIGMFSLFVMSRCSNPTVYAFEPAPAIYDILKANFAAYGNKGLPINAGVANREGRATFTFYEHSSVFSGFHADQGADGAALRAIIGNTLRSTTSLDSESLDRQVEEFAAGRLSSKAYDCRLTSLSALIREHQIEKVDLLKVDAEKSELDVLRGIDEQDWPKIAQIVIEVHDASAEKLGSLQDVLAQRGFRCSVEREHLLEDSGFVNLFATRREAPVLESAGIEHEGRDGVSRNVADFCDALVAFRERNAAPIMLCVAPRTPLAGNSADVARSIDAAEERLLSRAGSLPNVQAIGSSSIVQRYALDTYYDPHGDRLGDVPYTPACYVAIGTALCRAMQSASPNRFKVIALDCDNTLWKGICGEDGPQGIAIDPEHRRLQQLVVEQQQAGMLVCLCSKNNEKDVFDVFAQRPDMVLKREHLAAWRVNWDRKSGNLASLAAELNLGLDSFIFIDDSPLDCADIRIHCPDVLTLQLPGEAGAIPAFLDHVWVFDRRASTQEDRSRTRMIRDNADREQLRKSASSLKEFIGGLELRVEIGEPASDQIARISQLTFRTNQFNFTTIRRTEEEIRKFLARDDAGCLAVRVADRFGDYGLVGTVLYLALPDRLQVDTFLLSCRVLGRGVEHAVLADLARRALSQGKQFIELAYQTSERNAPARNFIAWVGAGDGGKGSRVLAAANLTGLRYDPDAATDPSTETSAREPLVSAVSTRAHAPLAARALERIAESLRTADAIAHAMEGQAGLDLPTDQSETSQPARELDAAILKIWRRVLGRPRIGINDNFFDAGGTSLKAVQVIAMIRRELERELSIVTLFECPTVATLASRLEAPNGATQPTAHGASTARGQRRRAAMTREAA